MNWNFLWGPQTAGGAAALGGVCWMVKAGAILVAGDQPPVLFEIGPLLFALGVIGLAQMLPVPRSRLGLGAQILATGAGLATLGSLVMTKGGTTASSEDDFSPLTFFGFIASILALLLVGIATRRQRALISPWHLLPLALSISFIPLIVIGGVLESINERLLELPLLILGLGWTLIGFSMLARRHSGSEHSLST